MTNNSMSDFEYEVPPEWLFHILVDGKPRAQVFAPKEKRNWVMWKLSQYVLGLVDEGTVTVKRLINGEWRDCNDWRNLTH